MVRPFRVSSPPRPTPFAAYLAALALPAAAFALQLAMRRWVEPIPFVFHFLAVALASWIGGFGPGLVCLLSSAVLGHQFLSSSANAVRAEGARLGSGLFVPVAVIIAGLGARVRAGFHERERAATELRQRERDLADAVRARDDFLSTASHELKTPLTALQLSVQLLARQVERSERPITPGELVARTSNLQRHASRLTGLVEQLLDVTRIKAGRLQLDLGEVDLGDLVEEVAGRFRAETESATCQVTVRSEPSVVGRWDRFRLDQVVTNLLSNALKYGAGQPVTVSVARRSDAAVIEVADRGVGIAPDEQARIFERFERGRRSRGQPGFGLGLWIVREIVAAHGGATQLESTPGRGSTFRIILPARSTRA